MSQSNFSWISLLVQAQRLQLQSPQNELPLADVLSMEKVQQVANEEGFCLRKCAWSPLATFWTFLWQALSVDLCCRAAISRYVLYCEQRGQAAPSTDTGPYCKARAKIPQSMLRRLVEATADDLSHKTTERPLLRGRRSVLIDGTVFGMPNTQANRQAYPPARQAKGRKSIPPPLMRAVVLICLYSGAALGVAEGPCQGKETGEAALFRQLWDRFCEGDVAVADRYFASFWNLAMLPQRGVDCVFRRHQLRKSDYRKGLRLGPLDHLIAYTKPKRPAWMDQATHEALPEEILVRELRVRVAVKGFRVRTLDVVTTLLDPQEYPREELAQTFRYRWHVELDIRSIKCVMQLDVLRCKTPAMLRKELWFSLLAYNLIRTVIADAAAKHHVPIREISFKGAKQVLEALRVLLPAVDAETAERLYTVALAMIVSHRVGDRPNRVEPRAVVRRPKYHPVLHEPRDVARSRLMGKT